jgi:oligoendopeptidase F
MGASMRWDLTSFFPSFDSDERARFEAELARDVDALFAEVGALGPLGAETRAAWAAALVRWEGLLARLSHLSSYTTALASADPEPRYRLAEARLDGVRATFEKVASGLRRALGDASETEARALGLEPSLSDAGFALERLRVEAATSMSAELEGLAADLGVDGIMGWGRLYDGLAARLCFTLRSPDGAAREVPMAQRRSLMADADRRVREAAFVAGNEAWRAVEDVAAAALNHIAGTRHTLYARRGVGHFLDVALRDAALSRRTLDAMMEAVRASAELPRRGLALKARAMGLPALAWFDLEAPLPLGASEGPATDGERVPFERALELVRGAFSRGYPALARHFDALLERRCVEAEPREGKRPGAYCTASDLTGEQRVYMTYQGSLGDLSTLAHEVGHAFHAEVMRDTRVLARQYPMTLAETASTFAEALLADGLLADPSLGPRRRALLLGEVVGAGASFLLDVPTRFAFEQAFYEERRAGELDAARLSQLMVEAQRASFGPVLAPGGEDPLFWASKLHFFIPDVAFYNFPYTFGFLLSRGLFAAFRAEGDAFLPRYEAFLRATGSGLAHEVARATLGRDLEAPEFWCQAIDTLRAPTDELEALLGSLGVI